MASRSQKVMNAALCDSALSGFLVGFAFLLYADSLKTLEGRYRAHIGKSFDGMHALLVRSMHNILIALAILFIDMFVVKRLQNNYLGRQQQLQQKLPFSFSIAFWIAFASAVILSQSILTSSCNLDNASKLLFVVDHSLTL